MADRNQKKGGGGGSADKAPPPPAEVITRDPFGTDSRKFDSKIVREAGAWRDEARKNARKYALWTAVGIATWMWVLPILRAYLS